MTRTFYIQGQKGGLLSTIARLAILAILVTGGLFMLVFATAFAFFAIAGIAIIGFVAYVFFWAKAKITGRPFGPTAQFEQMRKDMEAQMGSLNGQADMGRPHQDGPVVDAYRTPDGWSVDD